MNRIPAASPPSGSVQQPTGIGRKLLRFRTRKQHGVIQCMQKPGFADPAFFVDENPVHQRNLTGRAAKAEQADFQPDAKRILKRRDFWGHAVTSEAEPAYCPWHMAFV